MKRLNYIDYAKGMGIILVVWLHAGFLQGRAFDGVSAFHMPLFFIISGILLANSNIYDPLNLKEALRFIRKKAVRLLYPYATFGVFYCFFMIVSHMYEQSIPHFLKLSAIRFITLSGASVLWFLPALFFGEAFFIFILLGMKSVLKKASFNIQYICLTLIALSMLFITVPAQGNAKIIAPVTETGGLWALSVMTVGLRAALAVSLVTFGYVGMCVAKKLEIRLAKYIIFFIGIIALLAALLLSAFNHRVDMNRVQIGNPILFIINALLGSGGILFIANSLPDLSEFKKMGIIKRQLAIPFRMLSFAGKNSLIIMLTHLDWLILYGAGAVSIRLSSYITRARGYVTYALIATIVILAEWGLCVMINRFFPFLLRSSKRQS